MSKLAWKPGDKYTIRVVLRSRETGSPTYARELILHYRPPAVSGAGSVLLNEPAIRSGRSRALCSDSSA